jgi:hypothetical protein
VAKGMLVVETASSSPACDAEINDFITKLTWSNCSGPGDQICTPVPKD